MSRNVLMLAVAGTLVIASGTAVAATKTTNFGVSAVVNPNCIVNAAALNFGGYDGSALKAAQSDITVRCSNLTLYTLRLSTGGGTFAQRLLSGSGSNKLEYNLYTQLAATSIWGDGSPSTAVVTGTGAGMSSAAEKVHTVFGQLPNTVANQNAPSGSYSDTITVTIEY